MRRKLNYCNSSTKPFLKSESGLDYGAKIEEPIENNQTETIKNETNEYEKILFLEKSEDLKTEIEYNSIEEQNNKKHFLNSSIWKFDTIEITKERFSLNLKGKKYYPFVDGWELTKCPVCGNSKNDFKSIVWHPETGRFYCLNCGYKGDLSKEPTNFQSKNQGLNWNFWNNEENKKILSDLDCLKNFEIDFLNSLSLNLSATIYHNYETNSLEWKPSICFPFNKDDVSDVFTGILDFNGNYERSQRYPNKNPKVLNWENIETEVVFVDDVMDYLTFLSMGINNVSCLPDGLNPMETNKEAWKFTIFIEEKMKKIKKYTLAFSDHEIGHSLENEIARRLGKPRAWRIRWKNFFSLPNNLSNNIYNIKRYHSEDKNFEIEFNNAFYGATAFPVEGLYEVADVEADIESLYFFGMKKGCLTGYPTLSEHITFKEGQVTLISGIPSHGKTSLVEALSVNIAKKYGWSFGYFTPSNIPIARFYATMMEKYIKKNFNKKEGFLRIDENEKNEAKKWLQDHFKVILPKEEQGAWTLDAVFELTKQLILRYGIRCLVIDPWNELEQSRASHLTISEYLSAQLNKVRRFAAENDIHIFIINHPNKMEKGADHQYPIVTPYMLDGGAMWYNKAHNIISVYRNVGKKDSDIVDIHIQKISFEEIGKVGRISLRYDYEKRTYIDDIDQGRRESALKNLKKGEEMPSSRTMRIHKERSE